MGFVCRAGVLVLAVALGATMPAGTLHAEDGMPPGALAVLALFGAMPQYADARGFYSLGLTLPMGEQPSTTMFSGLVEGAEDATVAGWGVRPHLIMQGQYVGVDVVVQFDFGREAELTERLVMDRSFALNIRYHGGFNLFFPLGEQSPLMLTVGPTLDVLMGPRLRLRDRPEGETLGSAQWGRMAELSLVPSAMFALTRGPIVAHASAAWIPGVPPFNLLGYTAGQASGTLGEADPEDPDLRPDNPDNFGEARRSLQRIKPAGGHMLGAGIGVVIGGNREEARMLLSASCAWTRREYAVARGGFGLGRSFVEEDRRLMVGLGAYFPENLN